MFDFHALAIKVVLVELAVVTVSPVFVGFGIAALGEQFSAFEVRRDIRSHDLVFHLFVFEVFTGNGFGHFDGGAIQARHGSLELSLNAPPRFKLRLIASRFACLLPDSTSRVVALRFKINFNLVGKT